MTSPQLPDHVRAARRAKALALIATGKSLTEAAAKTRVAPSTLHYWIRNPRLAKPDGDRRYSLDYVALRRAAMAKPDATLHALAAQMGVSHNAIWKALARMGLASPEARRRARSQNRSAT